MLAFPLPPLPLSDHTENAIYAGAARDLHIRQPKELARFQS